MKSQNILLEFDKPYVSGRSFLLGVDEAGRGALAGPVVAAAMLIKADFYSDKKLLENLSALNDSKQLSVSVRNKLFESFLKLKELGKLDYEAGFGSLDEIEKLNILEATKLAMARAVEALDMRNNLQLKRNSYAATLFGEGNADISKALIIVDGKPLKNFPYRHSAIVKGDAKSFCIAAASIIAKVTRDNFMLALSKKYPQYEFEKHMGYATALHSHNILKYGASKEHRKTFLKNLRPDTIINRQQELF